LVELELREVGARLGLRPQISEHLARRGDLLLRAVHGAVLALGIVKAML
jgi:hypothetical protein